MKRLLLILALLPSLAFAELPPPGKARKGKITVDPYNKGNPSEYDLQNQKVINRADSRRVQKKLDALRNRIKDLESENQALRTAAERPVQPSGAVRASAPERIVEVRAPSKKNRLTALGGIGPDALTDRRKEAASANEVGLTQGLILGGQYSRLIGETWSITGQVTTTTRPEKKYQTYLGGVGFDF